MLSQTQCGIRRCFSVQNFVVKLLEKTDIMELLVLGVSLASFQNLCTVFHCLVENLRNFSSTFNLRIPSHW